MRSLFNWTAHFNWEPVIMFQTATVALGLMGTHAIRTLYQATRRSSFTLKPVFAWGFCATSSWSGIAYAITTTTPSSGTISIRDGHIRVTPSCGVLEDKALVIDLGRRVRPTITPDDPESVQRILAERTVST